MASHSLRYTLLLIALVGVTYGSAQTNSPQALIDTRGRDTYVSVVDPRPLYEAVIAVSQRYGWIVDYEDPVYSAQESKEVTAPEWRRSHPNARGVFDPSGGMFVANLGEIGEKPKETETLEKLVSQYNQSANPGYFRVIHAPTGRTIVSGRSRATPASMSNGVFDSIFQPAKEPEDAGTALEQLAKECSASSGVSIKVGIVPANAVNLTKVSGADARISCRVGIERILSSIPAASTYFLLYEIGEQSYFLSVVPAQQVVVGPDGKATLAPLRKSTL
jgi:hypothetical protein